MTPDPVPPPGLPTSSGDHPPPALETLGLYGWIIVPETYRRKERP